MPVLYRNTFSDHNVINKCLLALTVNIEHIILGSQMLKPMLLINIMSGFQINSSILDCFVQIQSTSK